MSYMDVLERAHRGREKEAWRKEILRHFNAGHYRRVLFMMAENNIDQGNVKKMIMEACRMTEPLPEWRNAGMKSVDGINEKVTNGTEHPVHKMREG